MPASRADVALFLDIKPYDRPERANRSRPKYVELDAGSDREDTPALSSASEDNDRSSDFAETPSPSPTKHNKVASYHHGDEDYDVDIKPVLGDDNVSSPGIVSDPYASDEAEQYSSRGGKSKVKAKGNAKGKEGKPRTPKKPKSAATSSAGGSGKKPGQAWTPDEDWILFQHLHPKTDKPNWNNVSAATGRDAKSCSNRYASMSKKLESMVKNTSR